MTDIQQKKGMKTTSSVNPIITGIAGAVAGGVAVAAAFALASKENQKKVTSAIDDAKSKTHEYVTAVKTQPVVEKTTKKIAEVTAEAKKKLVG